MNQNVIVLNCGSSSVKFAIVDAQSGHANLTGLAENMGSHDARLSYKVAGEKHALSLPSGASHQVALAEIQRIIKAQPGEPIGVGHRVVHGGEKFKEAVVITQEVKQAIAHHAIMAPLHNPANLMGIESAEQAFPGLTHVAVFDTAFFQTMPEHAYLYALPKSLYRDHGIRRYGFHGTSHQYVSEVASDTLNIPYENINLITAHLGNGCSVAAIKQGQAIDTSLGFTPLEGLVMGTRCGDIDPSLPSILSKQLNKSMDEIDSMLNKASGLLGISEDSNDCRTLEEAALEGDANAQLALQMFCYRLAKYIGSYLVVAGPIDGLVFTGGIGENSSYIRTTTLAMLAHLGFTLDENKNLDARFGNSGNISAEGTPILVIPTNEEWMIAKDTQRLTSSTGA
ncbi:acetate kinase [Alteromonas sp. 5E99-2]|uniref:acetate kinase n=1 Tax=Alteromonas sp. 5E99-2 TaxID=2817683 RepID=UPI001A99C026|nr:acetate kinase [Alteromonas sp. 5E99-2]MBO1254711.1 acetate kinase [Alteromonas sp. 5E99-2]